MGSSGDEYNLDDIVTRRHAGVRKNLTDHQFVFLWVNTYAHIPREQFGNLVKGLVGFVKSQGSPISFLSHLGADERLMHSLSWYLREIYTSITSNPEPLHLQLDTDVFELVVLLSEGMFVVEVSHHGEDIDEDICTCSFLLDAIGEISRIADVRGPSQLLARVCLARVRWSLLKLCYTAFEKKMPTVGSGEVPHFIRHTSRYGFRLNGRHPIGVLLATITGYYDGNRWTHRDTSSLLPLHDDACCTDWKSALTLEGLTHVIACNAFSTVAYLLESTDVQRENVENVLHGFFFRVSTWNKTLNMLETCKQKMPSSHFTSVLRSAGFDEWLEPGSKFNIKPHDGPNFKFLTTDHAKRCGPHCVHLLKELAERVNFVAYHAANVTRSSTEALAKGESEVQPGIPR
ncbi:unnamed protein product [Peniophora sp. CBMAI 1063]|nr:unnamed protein product [Peniophora sp. CBMAI 1063]